MLTFNPRLLSAIKGKRNLEVLECMLVEILKYKHSFKWLVDITGNTLLHHAASYGNEIVTQYLIKKSGCNVDAQNEDLKTAIMLAVEARHEATVKVLLEANANIKIVDSRGKSVLHIISERTESIPLSIARLFLERVKRDACCRKQIARILFDANWPLFYAVSMRDTKLTRIMLELGSPIDAVASEFKITGLHGAVLLVDPDNVKMLVDHGADVNIKCADRSSPLGSLHKFDNTEDAQKIIKILLERGTRWTDCDTNIPMQIYDVCVFGQREIVRTLIECNVDLCVEDANGETLLHYLVENKNPGVFEELRGQHFDVDVTDGFGLTPLHKAVWCDNVEAIQFLIESGADVKITANNGFPPIFYAFVGSYRSFYNTENEEDDDFDDRKDKRIIEILLDHGAEIEVSNDQGIVSVFELSHFKNSPLAKMVIARVAMLDVLGRPMNEIIRKNIDRIRWMKRHFDLYKQRYERMRITRVYESVTLLDLLTKSDKQIMYYARNRQLVLNLALIINEGTPYCYHYRFIQKRLTNAVVKIDIRKKAVVVLSRITQYTCSNPRVIADVIINYLEERDWVTLEKLL